MADTVVPRLRARRDHMVVEIVIDNPARRNAMTLAMWQDLDAVLQEVDERETDRVVVLRGGGAGAFCSGNDVSEYAEKRTTPEQIAAYNAVTSRATQRMRCGATPTIAAINGPCIGGGLHLAMLCDLRVANQTATFSIPSARLGLPYRFDGVRTLLGSVPAACVREMLLTGGKFDSAFAMRWGLINQCVATGDFDAAVADLAAAVCRTAPLTHRCTKLALEQLLHADVPDIALVEAAESACYASDDYREGLASFRDKRPAVFKGR